MITEDDSDDAQFDVAMAEIQALPLRISQRHAVVLGSKAVATGCSVAAIIESIIDEWADGELRCFATASEKIAIPKSDELESRSRERSAMTPSLRLSILQRDGHKCQSCGAMAPEVKLHVDHIIAIANGGKTVSDNLQTLCESCNLAKAAKVVELPAKAARK